MDKDSNYKITVNNIAEDNFCQVDDNFTVKPDQKHIPFYQKNQVYLMLFERIILQESKDEYMLSLKDSLDDLEMDVKDFPSTLRQKLQNFHNFEDNQFGRGQYGAIFKRYYKYSLQKCSRDVSFQQKPGEKIFLFKMIDDFQQCMNKMELKEQVNITEEKQNQQIQINNLISDEIQKVNATKFDKTFDEFLKKHKDQDDVLKPHAEKLEFRLQKAKWEKYEQESQTLYNKYNKDKGKKLLDLYVDMKWQKKYEYDFKDYRKNKIAKFINAFQRIEFYEKLTLEDQFVAEKLFRLNKNNLKFEKIFSDYEGDNIQIIYQDFVNQECNEPVLSKFDNFEENQKQVIQKWDKCEKALNKKIGFKKLISELNFKIDENLDNIKEIYLKDFKNQSHGKTEKDLNLLEQDFTHEKEELFSNFKTDVQELSERLQKQKIKNQKPQQQE